MKQLIAAVIISAVFTIGCSSSKKAALVKEAQVRALIDTLGRQEQLADTFLHRLQQENELVIAAGTASLAWGQNYNYTIAVRNHGTWQGYVYTISGTRANPRVGISNVAIDSKAADEAALQLNNTALWTGKDNHETCNMQVADGSASSLLVAAGSKVLRNQYYMPEVYQQNCPDSSRQLFIEAFGKVRGLAGNGNAQ